MKKTILIFIILIILIGEIYSDSDVNYFKIKEVYDNALENYSIYPGLGPISVSVVDYQSKNAYLFFKKKGILMKVFFNNSSEEVILFNIYNKYISEDDIGNIIALRNNIIVFSKKDKKLYIFSNNGGLKNIIKYGNTFNDIKYILPYKNEKLLIINNSNKIYLIDIKGKIISNTDIIKNLKINVASIIKYTIENDYFYYLSSDNKIYRYSIKTGENKKELDWFPNRIIDFSIDSNNNLFISYSDGKKLKVAYVSYTNKIVKVFYELLLDEIFEINVRLLNVNDHILIIGNRGYRIYKVNKIINE
ncbi:hypothetical protein XO12_02115 [Marinitoga sp. 1154]|uniref:hypothetical protein n=1 Tax=Marinitoga sp. 1154 TaxID=1643335 RepID=UPI00158658DE|nr:hypothetical protein [Marinitoga sp. 1154]NUU98959.1 hypothetical protein [Marinitoga sp. 1154]